MNPTKGEKTMKTFFLYVRQYDFCTRDYRLYVYKVTTDNIYRIIGKMYCTALEEIKRIDYNEYLEERENFWIERGYTIEEYKGPKLRWD